MHTLLCFSLSKIALFLPLPPPPPRQVLQFLGANCTIVSPLICSHTQAQFHAHLDVHQVFRSRLPSLIPIPAAPDLFPSLLQNL